ncbi:hypothetical protein BDB01DRAFT_846675 [Pilobolus umbonatus]|nr:hypothetical protein BDB01DRAFT_846675 [Pilobolus umbonatus]
MTLEALEELFRARERQLQSSPSQLKDNLKQYKKTVQRYNHDTEQINKEFIRDLKRWKVDAHQLVNTIHKITETTRVQARASTELFDQLQYLQTRAEFTSPKDRDIYKNTAEQALRLAIYGFSPAKQQDKEA